MTTEPFASLPIVTHPRPRPAWRTPLIIAAVVLVTVGLALTALALASRAADAPRVVSSPSPTVKVASVQQYAGIVNSTMKDMRKTWDDYADGCVLILNPDRLCPLLATGLDVRANILVLSLQNAANPKSTAYIGAPPAELERLVARTLDAARNVMTVIEPEVTRSAQVHLAMIPLLEIFDEWEPYI